jgi:acetyl-CoA C-acetyltransferase
MSEIFAVAAVRTAIGTFGGALHKFEPGELAARVTREVIRRAGTGPAAINPGARLIAPST